MAVSGMNDDDQLDGGEQTFPDITFTIGQSCNKVRCEPGWSWNPKVPMQDYDLWYAVSGTGEIRVNEEAYEVRKGCLFLLRPGDIIRATQDPADRLLIIFVHFSYVRPGSDGEGTDWREIPTLTHFEDPYHVEYFLHRIIELKDMNETWSKTEFDFLMKLIFIHLTRMNEGDREVAQLTRRHKQLVHKAIDVIRMRSDTVIDFEQIAAVVGLSPRYLSTLFRKHTGLSLKEYMTRQRLERAKFLLTDSDMNVTQIADILGYSDIYYFSKLFKQIYGIPPTSFRNRHTPAKPVR